MSLSGYFIALLITVVLELVVFYYIRKRGNKRSQLVRTFELTMVCMMLWCVGLMVQILVINYISPDLAVYVDYFIYIPIVLTPVALFFVSYVFTKKEINVEKIIIIL